MGLLGAARDSILNRVSQSIFFKLFGNIGDSKESGGRLVNRSLCEPRVFVDDITGSMYGYCSSMGASGSVMMLACRYLSWMRGIMTSLREEENGGLASTDEKMKTFLSRHDAIFAFCADYKAPYAKRHTQLKRREQKQQHKQATAGSPSVASGNGLNRSLSELQLHTDQLIRGFPSGSINKDDIDQRNLLGWDIKRDDLVARVMTIVLSAVRYSIYPELNNVLVISDVPGVVYVHGFGIMGPAHSSRVSVLVPRGSSTFPIVRREPLDAREADGEADVRTVHIAERLHTSYPHVNILVRSKDGDTLPIYLLYASAKLIRRHYVPPTVDYERGVTTYDWSGTVLWQPCDLPPIPDDVKCNYKRETAGVPAKSQTFLVDTCRAVVGLNINNLSAPVIALACAFMKGDFFFVSSVWPSVCAKTDQKIARKKNPIVGVSKSRVFGQKYIFDCVLSQFTNCNLERWFSQPMPGYSVTLDDELRANGIDLSARGPANGSQNVYFYMRYRMLDFWNWISRLDSCNRLDICSAGPYVIVHLCGLLTYWERMPPSERDVWPRFYTCP